MNINNRVLHHTESGCTDPKRAGTIVKEQEGGYVVKWHINYPSGLEVDVHAWYEPQELVLFAEAELETADHQRELVFEFNQSMEAKESA